MEKRLTRQDLLDVLEGMEILSIDFEGCVMIKDGKIIQNGEVIDPKPTRKTLMTLLEDEYNYELLAI